MKRRKLSAKEDDQLRKVQRENERLKKEISRLRKELARVDIEKLVELEEIADIQERRIREKEKEKQEQAAYREKWLCHVCGRDILKLILITRPDGIYYLRRCSCGKKTKLQKYDESVEK
jgi:hypothetical protein